MIRAVETINQNNLCLRGYLHIPDNFTGKLVVFFHGFTGNLTEHGGIFRDFSRLISKHGFASLRFDFSNNGESDGCFCDFTYDTLMADAVTILDYGKNIAGVKDIILLGFSMGGAVAAYLAGRRPCDITRLLLWSPAGNLTSLIKNRYEKATKLANGNIDCPNFPISKALYESLFKYDWHDGLEKYQNPVLIMHGQSDQAVKCRESYRYGNLFPKALVYLVTGAGHGYDRQAERQKLFQKSLEFIAR